MGLLNIVQKIGEFGIRFVEHSYDNFEKKVASTEEKYERETRYAKQASNEALLREFQDGDNIQKKVAYAELNRRGIAPKQNN